MLYIYKSSAGSGKTFTLVKEYLKIIFTAEKIDAYKHILAITFTNKAANEMKERILHSLTAIGNNDSDKMLLQLHTETELPKIVLQQKAIKIKQHLLHHYSDFSVMTIDAFTNKIIKAFAFDLKIPSNYTIELDVNKVAREAIYNLLKDISGVKENELTKILLQWLKSYIEEDKGNSIEYGLQNTAILALTERLHRLFDKNKHTFPSEYFDDLAALQKIKKEVEQTLKTLAENIRKNMFSNGLTIADYYRTQQGIAGYIHRICESDFSRLEMNSYVLDSINNEKYYTAKTTDEIKGTIDLLKPNFHPQILELQQYFEDNKRLYYSATVLIQNFFPFVMLTTLDYYIQQYKQENNLLLISDFHQLIYSMIATQSIPVIYERIGEKYTSILIDEFQDTSALQWQNLLPLVVNSQENYGISLIVGDTKQAIYRFRGGNVEQFAALPAIPNPNNDEIITEREIVINNYGFEEIILETNYRSNSTVIDFNNQYFESLSHILSENNQVLYKNNQQKIFNNETGYVEVSLLEKDNFEEECTQKILSTIHTAINNNFLYKDIAILTRSNKTAIKIAEFLLAQNIPVVSEESLLINNSPEVQQVIALMKYLHDSENMIRKSEVITQFQLLNINLEIDTFIATIHLPTYKFEKFISTKINDTFSGKELRKKPLLQLVYQLLETFKLYDKQNAFIQYFLDEIINFSQSQSVLLQDFLYWWEDKKHTLSITYPDTLDAVKIMTIHKSKGLQFPIVILPLLKSKNNTTDYIVATANDLPLNNNLWALKATKSLIGTTFETEYNEENELKLLDDINLQYVAFTRAETALFILCENMEQKENPATPIDFFIAFVKKNMNQTDNQYYWQNNEMPYKKNINSTPQQLYHLTDFDAKNNINLTIKKTPNFENKINDFGNNVHLLLQQIATTADLQKLSYHNFSTFMNSETYFTIITIIEKIINNEAIGDYFNPNKIKKIYTERNLLNAAAAIKRPDRITVMKNGDTILIDYKTGKKSNTDIIQIKEYAAILTALHFNVKKCIVIYINNEDISIETIAVK